MKILIVDDDKLILIAISNKLKAKGYDVLTATDGMEALEIINNKNVDLVISDIIMPGISGLALVSLLKQFYFNTIPVILISSLSQAYVISKSISWGAYDFILKPIDFNELYIKVKGIGKNQA